MQDLEQRIKRAQSEIMGKHGKKTNAHHTSPTRMIIDLLAGIGVGSGLGYFLDQTFSTLPLFLFLCSIFGVAGGFYNFYKDCIRKYDNENKK